MTGVALFLIYTLFSGYREEEFQQRQKEKITTTLTFLTEIKQIDNNIINKIDRLNINKLFDEKLLIFDKDRKLIYSSIDDTPITFSREIINDLSPAKRWIEKKDELYDVVGVYIENSGIAYYGISKAFDTFGYTKLNYLKNVLFATFLIISVLVVLVSLYLSRIITKPIADITERINNYDFLERFIPIETKDLKNEITQLGEQFNILIRKMNDAFAFQKHAVHHISHELKTPITILVSNFERIEKETDIGKIRALIEIQKEDTRNLSEIINALLEISNAETGNIAKYSSFRIDEMIFDVAEELSKIYPDFQFSIEYAEADEESKLVILADARLVKSALMNLMLNCIHYSDNGKAKITMTALPKEIRIDFENSGKVIGEEEKKFLFQHFFRGENSQGKRGFGLGLVFIHKIITLHGGRVSYASAGNNTNTFVITLPLR